MTIHIIITMVLLLAFLIGSIWYAKKKYQINLAVVGLGGCCFLCLFTDFRKNWCISWFCILKKTAVLPLAGSSTSLYHLWLSMAAFFEETARLVFFKWLEKKRGLEKADALAYGLGHGGLELIFLGLYQFDQFFTSCFRQFKLRIHRLCNYCLKIC